MEDIWHPTVCTEQTHRKVRVLFSLDCRRQGWPGRAGALGGRTPRFEARRLLGCDPLLSGAGEHCLDPHCLDPQLIAALYAATAVVLSPLCGWQETDAPEPLGGAPTSSVVAQEMVVNALVVELIERSGFDTKDFATNHPGGSLGVKLGPA